MKGSGAYLSVPILCIFFLIAASAEAAIVDFATGQALGSGTVTYDGTNVTGTNIPLDEVSGIATPGGAGVHNLSGPLGVGTTYAALNFNSLAHSISITGGVPDFQIPDTAVLFTGTLVSWSLSSLGMQFLLTLRGYGTMAPLAAHFGLPVDTSFNFLMLSVASKGQGSTYLPLNVDFAATAVPLPSSCLLLAFGLLGLVVSRTRTFRTSRIRRSKTK